MNKPIFTAVSMIHRQTNHEVDDDLQSMMTQPLLLNDDQEDDDDDCCDNTIVVFQTKTNNKATQTTSTRRATTTTTSSTPTSCHSSRFVLFGTLTGFAIQVISLGAYALLLLHYSSGSGSITDSATTSLTPPSWPGITATSNNNNNSTHSILSLDWFVYGLLSILTQIDLVLYVVIWIAFTCTMTSGGMQCLKLQFQSQQSNTTLTRRTVFVWGVYFLVGIVLGAFAAWSVIDVYLGFPIPFLPIMATVGIDLVLCYLMVCCYDLGRRNTNGNTTTSSGRKSATHEDVDDDDDEDEDECMCC